MKEKMRPFYAKWKVSQNQSLKNQHGVIDGLNANNQPTMAILVKAEIIE